MGGALFDFAWERRTLIDGTVILAGGSPTILTVRYYCDAAYALIIGEHQRAGLSLEEAVEKLSDWAVGIAASAEEREERRVARQNARAMAEFTAKMAALSG